MELLDEIRAAFPAMPYPGDDVLSKCWCDECAWEVRNLRGKSWKQTRVEDFNAGDGGRLSLNAFRYYLPAQLQFAVEHPDELHFASEVIAHFVAVAGESDTKAEAIHKTVSRLSKPQRTTLVHFFQWVESQGWQAPLHINAAIKAAGDGIVEPISADEVCAWARAKQAGKKAP